MDFRRRQFLLAAGAMALPLGSRNGWAQAYPTRPIMIDTVARIMAEGMRKTLGQPIIIENVAGASATIGVGRVARAAGDGYTVAPEVPTVDEAGLPGFYVSNWHGVWAPKGTPDTVINTLSAAILDALANATVRQQLIDLGQEIPPLDRQKPEGLAELQRAEIEKWWPIVKSTNIKAE